MTFFVNTGPADQPRLRPTPTPPGSAIPTAASIPRPGGGSAKAWATSGRGALGGPLDRPLLVGDGRRGPRVEQLRISFDEEGYAEHLPAIYRLPEKVSPQPPPGSRDTLERFLALFASFFDDVEHEIGDLRRLFDPATTPADWLDWLAGWLALELEEGWSEAKKRRILAGAFAAYAWKGTARGLARALADRLGIAASIEEAHAQVDWWVLPRDDGGGSGSRLGFSTRLAVASPQGAVLGSSATLDGSHLIEEEDLGEPLFTGTAYQFSVTLPRAQASTPAALAAVRELVEREKPAHTSYQLCFVDPGIRVGYQALLGVDTIVGGGPPPASRLGEATGEGAGARRRARRPHRRQPRRCLDASRLGGWRTQLEGSNRGEPPRQGGEVMGAMRAADAACCLEAPERNRYFHGQMLYDRNFRLETDYHNHKRWLINRLVLGWGVVCGLAVREAEGDEPAIVVECGVALDRCGREIVVDEEVTLVVPKRYYEGVEAGEEGESPEEYRYADEERRYLATHEERRRNRDDDYGGPERRRRRRHRHGVDLHLVLCYHECTAEPTPVLAGDCRDEEPCQPGLIRERYSLEFRPGCRPSRRLRLSIADVISPDGRVDYEALVAEVSKPCPCPDDCCIPLANVHVDRDGDSGDCHHEIDMTVRPIVLTNDLLFQLILSAVSEPPSYRSEK